MVIEAKSLIDLVRQFVLPAAFEYKGELRTGKEDNSEAESLVYDRLSDLLNHAYQELVSLEEHLALVKDAHGAAKLLPIMSSLRTYVDSIEENLPDSKWALPKYSELFFA